MPTHVVIEHKWKVTVHCPENTQRVSSTAYRPEVELLPVRVECEWTQGKAEPVYQFWGPRILKTGVPGRPIDGTATRTDQVPDWMLKMLDPYKPIWDKET